MRVRPRRPVASPKTRGRMLQLLAGPKIHSGRFCPGDRNLPTKDSTPSLRTDAQIEKRPHLRICGITEGIPTLQVAEVLDVTQRVALVEHQRMVQPDSPCFLQLGNNGDLSTIRCRVVHARMSYNRPDGGLSCQTMVEFLDLRPAAERVLRNLVQSLGTNGGCETGGP